MIISPAVAGDEAAIRSCAEEAYAGYVAAIGRRPAPMEADYAAQIAKGHVHVAIGDKGQLAGFITFFPQDDAMLLENVAVRKAASGQGIGKALIGFCEQTARHLGLESVWLYTNAKMVENLAIYPRLGYAETSRGTQDGFERVFFEKRLR